MALWACNSPHITGPVLSFEITKLVAARAKAAVANVLQKRKSNTTGLLVALSTGKREGEGSKQKRCVVSHNATVNNISPISHETHENADVSSAPPTFLQPHFLSPYLMGKPTQFKGKVKARITMLLVSINLPLPVPVQKKRRFCLDTMEESPEECAVAQRKIARGGHRREGEGYNKGVDAGICRPSDTPCVGSSASHGTVVLTHVLTVPVPRELSSSKRRHRGNVSSSVG